MRSLGGYLNVAWWPPPPQMEDKGQMADFSERQIQVSPRPGDRRSCSKEPGAAKHASPENGYPVAVLCHPQPAGSSMDDPLTAPTRCRPCDSGSDRVTLRFSRRWRQ